MAEEESVFVLDIEKKLAADASGEYRDRLEDLIKIHAAGVKAAMDKGMTPEDFGDAKTVLAGLDTASEILQQTWKNMHG